MNFNAEKGRDPEANRVLQSNEKVLLKECNLAINLNLEDAEKGQGKGLLRELSQIDLTIIEEGDRVSGEDKEIEIHEETMGEGTSENGNGKLVRKWKRIIRERALCMDEKEATNMEK